MIRPTMSHAANKDHFIELLSKYATYLEQALSKINRATEQLQEQE